jgi:hypothetical protein
MGISTDAYLYYGIDFATDSGPNPPWMLSEDSQFYGWDEWKYSPLEQAKKERLDELGIDIDSHQHCEHPVYFIHTEESMFMAWRGYPKDTTDRQAGDNADARLKEACEIIGINFVQPKWILASYSDF